MRTGDFEGAIHTFCQVLELHRRGKVTEAAYADALFLAGESYFKDEQHLSAARHYRELVDKGMRRPFDAYLGRALSRLVDVFTRTEHPEILDYVFAKLNELPSADASGSLQYARGKAYFARGDLGSARRSLEAVTRGGDFVHQAGYALGVVALKEGMARPDPPKDAKGKSQPAIQKFAAAVEQFHKVTQMPADSEAHRHVIDLSWMALGRILYETENYLDAADAYSHVDRVSPEFSDMLYELSWVYVRLGDVQRAQRALEVLSITAPETLDLADTSLLRADLMLRARVFDKALELYQGVRQEFEPMREKVIAFMDASKDPAVYYDLLVDEDVFLEEKGGLPRTVIKWVREAAKGDRSFHIIDDQARSRSLLKKSKELVRKLTAVLRSPTRVRAFPDLKAGLERTVALLNKIAIARKSIGDGMDDVRASGFGGELGQARTERRSLAKRVMALPVAEGDFFRRENAAEGQWNGVSQKLQGLTIEADRLQAKINAIRSVIGRRDPGTRERLKGEIEGHERELLRYRELMASYREAIEIGRVQVGFGDQRFVDDADVRARHRQSITREAQLAAGGGGDADSAAYARSVLETLSRADAVEARLEGVKRELEEKIRVGADEIQKQVDAEADNLREYSGHLAVLDDEARKLIGEAAMRNFAIVRERLKSIILRADTGIVQQAWEMREEQRLRVRDLQRERAREEQNLNDELREVLDDAGGEK